MSRSTLWSIELGAGTPCVSLIVASNPPLDAHANFQSPYAQPTFHTASRVLSSAGSVHSGQAKTSTPSKRNQPEGIPRGRSGLP